MESIKKVKKLEKSKSEHWPDLPVALRWVLRFIFLGLLGWVSYTFFSASQTVWVEARINNGRDYTYHVVPPVGGIETKLRFDHLIDAEWINDEEIIVLGSFEDGSLKPHPHFLEIFDLNRKFWRVSKHDPFDQYCPEGTVAVGEAKLQPYKLNQVILIAPCKVKPASNLESLATYTIILLISLETDKAHTELISTINRANSYNPDEHHSLAIAPNLEELAFGWTSPDDTLANGLTVTDFKSIHPFSTDIEPEIHLGPFTLIDWSLSNEKLALTAYQDSEPQTVSDGIYSVDLRTKESDRLTPRATTVTNMEWINDDQELFFTGRLMGTSGAWIVKPSSQDIWLYDIRRGYKIPQSNSDQSAMALSPDGSRIFGIGEVSSYFVGEPDSPSLKIIEYPTRNTIDLESRNSLDLVLKNQPESPEVVRIEDQPADELYLKQIGVTRLSQTIKESEEPPLTIWLDDQEILFVSQMNKLDIGYYNKRYLDLDISIYNWQTEEWLELIQPDEICRVDRRQRPETQFQPRKLYRMADGELVIEGICPLKESAREPAQSAETLFFELLINQGSVTFKRYDHPTLENQIELIEIDWDGNSRTQDDIAYLESIYFNYLLSPDGSLFASTSVHEPQQLSIRENNLGSQRNTSSLDYWPNLQSAVWVDGSDEIIFEVARKLNRLYRFDLNTSQSSLLLDDVDPSLNLSVSADATHLIFPGRVGTGSQQQKSVWALDLESNKLTQILPLENNALPVFASVSPNGQFLFIYEHQRDRNQIDVFQIDPISSGSTQSE